MPETRPNVDDMLALANDWRNVLSQEIEHARPIISRLLIGRVTFRPLERRRWEMSGTGTLAGLFIREIFPSVWRPQRDSILQGIPFIRRFAA